MEVTSAMMYVANSTKATGPEGCLNVGDHEFLSSTYPEDPVSLALFHSFAAISNGVFVPIFFIIGASTNTINMVVFYKHGLKERISLCVFCLAFTDLMYLCAGLLAQADNPISVISQALGITKTSLGPFMQFFVDCNLYGLYGFHWASQMISVIVACERCLCVLLPLKSRSLLSTRMMVILICTICTPTISMCFIVSARWKIACLFDAIRNETTVGPVASQFYANNRQLVDVLNGTVYGIVLPGVCITLAIVTTTITVVKLKKMTRWRERTSSARTLCARDIALTRMLVGCTIFFISCSTPSFAVFTISMFIPGLKLSGKYNNTSQFLIKVFEVASFTNSSFNFFIYYKFGTKFRQTVKDIFRCGHAPVLNRKLSYNNPTAVSADRSVSYISHE